MKELNCLNLLTCLYEWERLDLLAREKEVVGIYISDPLDDYAFEIKHNCNHTIENLRFRIN
ncbi:MAG: hypothetical protein CM15mP107_3720 [Bacteroidota bacterium]|nr:MAG: hypothetical protein CM15mP107_3720 [Bacteroidota bacterium]